MDEAPARELPVAVVRSRRHDAGFLALALAIVAADQASKWLLRRLLEQGDSWPEGWAVRLVHYTNTGAAFGMLQGATPLLALASIVGMAALAIYLFNPAFIEPGMRLGVAFMLGGTVGNLVDRLGRGEVVDWVKFPRWPAFNVADSSITIGVLLLAWAMLREGGGAKEAAG